MDGKRKGEIAYELLKYKAKKEGVFFGRNKRREWGNIAKATGIPLKELEEFSRTTIEELTDETFGPAEKE